MTTVTFLESGNLITGFIISGHSGFAEEDSDIVCAAISSAAIMTANTITDIYKIKANVTERDGYLSIKMSPKEAENVSEILQGLQLHLNFLSEQYPKYIKLKFSEV